MRENSDDETTMVGSIWVIKIYKGRNGFDGGKRGSVRVTMLGRGDGRYR